MALVADVLAKLRADTTQFKAAMSAAKKQTEDVTGSTEGLGKKGIATGAALGTAFGTIALGALSRVSAGFHSVVDDAVQFQTVGMKVAQTIASTGGAAGVTVDQVRALSASIESMSGIDENLISNAQNLLLTFTQLRNEAGAGNDIFNQATQAVADLSTTMNGDMQGAAIQVGKALNDPVKGVMALRRVGVSFTADQISMIKSLVASGHQLDAQKLILKELNTEFGGAAAAAGAGFGGAVARAKDAVSDMLRGALLPLLDPLAKMANWLSRNTDILSAITGALVAMIVPVLAIIGVIKAWAVVQAILNSELYAALAPFLPIIAAVGLLVGAFILAWKKSETFRNIVTTVINAVAKAFGVAIGWIMNMIGKLLLAYGSVMDSSKGLGKVIAAVWNIIIKVITVVIGSVLKIYGTLIAGIGNLLESNRGLYKVVSWVFNAIAKVIGGEIAGILKTFGLLLRGVSWIADQILGYFDTIVGGAAKAFGWLPEIGGDIKDAASGFSDMRKSVTGAIDGAAAKLDGWATSVQKFSNKDIGTKVVDGIITAAKTVGTALQASGQAVIDFGRKDIGSKLIDGIGAGATKAGQWLIKTGENISATLGKGIMGGSGEVTKAATNVGKSAGAAAAAAFKPTADQLKTAADQGNAALDTLKGIAKQAMDLNTQVAQNMADFGKVSQVEVPEGVTLTADYVTGQLQRRLELIKSFGGKLQKLSSLGLNPAALQDIIGMGPIAGSQIADALISEGKTAVAKVGGIYKQVQSAAAGIGNTASMSVFGMNANQAQAVQNTNVTVESGAIKIEFGKGITAQDATAITAIVNEAVQKSFTDAARSAARGKTK